MRLARIGPPGSEVPMAAAADGGWLDLSPMTADIDAAFIAGGLDDARRALASGRLTAVAEPPRLGNDVSERAFQTERGGQWDKGKNCETFNSFVALGRADGAYLRAGDVVELEIDGLGRQRQQFGPA